MLAYPSRQIVATVANSDDSLPPRHQKVCRYFIDGTVRAAVPEYILSEIRLQ